MESRRSALTNFFTGICDQKEIMTFEDQMECARQIGLRCTMVHCAYYERRLNSFWLPGPDGDAVAADYITQIERCGKYTENFVVHLNGPSASITSEIGVDRLKKMLTACEKFGLNICVENLYSATEIPYIFSRISHPLLKICYDCGYRNCLTPEFDICKNYGQYIAVLHLHENDGSGDQHKIFSVNSPVFQKLQQDLKYLDDDIVLASEARMTDNDWQGYLRKNLQVLSYLDQ